MATKTSHLGLTKPVYTEKADVQAINGNMDILDKEVAKRTRVSNLLVNSNFADVINWQGLSSYTGQIYGIDCWYGRSIAQTVAPRSADVTVTATGTSYAGIKQMVKNIAEYAGKTLTFACNVYATAVPQLSFTDASNVTLASVRGSATRQQTLVLNYTIPANATADTVIPTIVLETSASGDYMRLYWAALYEGTYTIDSLPAYIVPDKKLEMIRCGAPEVSYNLLDNSDFRSGSFVANLGLRAYYDKVLCVGNRWLCNPSITTVTQQTDGVLLGNTNAQYAYICQKVNVKTGKKYTFAVCATNVSGTHRIATYNSNNSVIYTQDYANNRELLITTFTAGEDVVSMLYYPGYASDGGSAVIKWAALYEGTYTAETLPPYVPKGKKVEMLNCGVPLQPANLLDNSDFLNPINQRGTTSTKTSGDYIADRWKTDSASSAATVSISSVGITLEPTTSNYAGIYQKIEHYAEMSGKIYTLGVCINDAWEATTFTMANESGGKKLPSGLRIYSTGNSFHILIRNTAGAAPVTIQHVALYEGSYTADTLPEYQPKEPVVELMQARTQLQPLMRGQKDEEFIATYIPGASYLKVQVPLNPPMRVAPSVYNAGNAMPRAILYDSAGNVSVYPVTEIGLAASTTTSITLRLAVGSALPTDYRQATVDNMSNSSDIFASAEM